VHNKHMATTTNTSNGEAQTFWETDFRPPHKAHASKECCEATAKATFNRMSITAREFVGTPATAYESDPRFTANRAKCKKCC